ncbi:MAG TPA: GNAT family N-acetyltransferase [Patescibacteria group bacterium]
MKLIAPSVEYEQDYLAAIEESKREAAFSILPVPLPEQSFADFIQNRIDQALGVNLPTGFVPSTELWLIDKDEFVGRTNLRHFLNGYLLKIGGHIGYWIRPSKRKRGYGKIILQLALKEARKIGIKEILVTCDTTNERSRRVIEANGGILENIVKNGDENPPKMRYWFT